MNTNELTVEEWEHILMLQELDEINEREELMSLSAEQAEAEFRWREDPHESMERTAQETEFDDSDEEKIRTIS